MPGPNSLVTSVDGSVSWDGGVDSLKVPTVSSASNPNGLNRNQLAWLNNAILRDGGITPRPGWKRIGSISPSSTTYQGGYMYRPIDGDPYLVLSISGNITKVAIDPFLAQNLSVTSSVMTVPTPGPWTVTLQYMAAYDQNPYPSNIPPGLPIPVNPYKPDPNYPVGSLFSQATSGYTGILGYGPIPADTFVPFVIPPVGSNVVVNMGFPYYGTHNGVPIVVGSIIDVAGPRSVTGPLLAGSVPPLLYYDTITYSLRFKIIDVTPAFQQITVNLPSNPNTLIQAYFEQAEEFLIIQAGDYKSLPFFWDDKSLRRSRGITNSALPAQTNGINEIPAAGPMDYYMDRLWYSQGNTYSAGDIVGGPSGTSAYGFRDSILNVTENPLCFGGDGFSVPRNDGNITALNHNANQDSALGQGRLFSFTGKGCYALSVPVTRTDWIKADTNTKPLQVPIQLANGSAGDRCVIPVNGDLFFQSLEPHWRSLITATRFFNQWSNVPISAPMQRILQFTDRALMPWATGILFDNRAIQSALPIATPQGIVHQALMVLDFEPLSKFETGLEPIWNGMWQGLDILQLFTGLFDGEERAFATVVSRVDQSIELWELTKDYRFDNNGTGDNRIQMQIEYPAFEWGQVFAMKKVVSAELWIDRLFGETVFLLEYRPDGESCWTKWHEWKVCAPKNTCENPDPDPCTGLTNVMCYPANDYGESYRQTLTLPKPPLNCNKTMGRPSNECYQMQTRLTVTGFCRVRGFLISAESVETKLYHTPTC